MRKGARFWRCGLRFSFEGLEIGERSNSLKSAE